MTLRPIGISVYSPNVMGALVELQGVGKLTLDKDGYCLFNIDASWPNTHLFINADGYEPYSHHVSLPLDGLGKDIILTSISIVRPNTIVLPPLISLTSVGLSQITISGKDFLLNNQRFKIKGCSDFLLLYRKSIGQDIRPILEQRKKIGVDTLRIFTMAYNIVQFNPKTYDVGFWLNELLDEMSIFELRAEIEGFADVQFIGLTNAEQQKHHEIVTNVIRTKNNAIYDLCNEFDKNGIIPSRFNKPNGVISSSGSRQNNKPPTKPYWDYGTFHPRRDGEDYYFSKWRADVGPSSEVYYGVEGESEPNFPIVADEPRGFATDNDPGRRSNNPAYAYQIGWLYGTFLNGAMFHSTNGVYSELFDDVTLKCAIQFLKGCNDAEQSW